MTQIYRATFVIPNNSQRILSDTGWEFSSSMRIPAAVVDHLMSALMLAKSGSFAGMDQYVGRDAQATVLLDDEGNAEHIYVRSYDKRDVHGELQRAVGGLEVIPPLEVFTPSSLEKSGEE